MIPPTSVSIVWVSHTYNEGYKFLHIMNWVYVNFFSKQIILVSIFVKIVVVLFNVMEHDKERENLNQFFVSDVRK